MLGTAPPVVGKTFPAVGCAKLWNHLTLDNITNLGRLVNMSNVSLKPEQVRAARGLIAWSQADLSTAAKVARATLVDFEAGKRTPYERTLQDIREALESAGVIFVAENDEGPGVRLRKTKRK